MNEIKKENPHKNHRQRVKNRFFEEKGFDSFDEHNILEMLLFYAVPQKDTNELAHSLINHFGSLKNVFDASYEDLCRLKGVTPNIACLIKMIPSLSKVYYDSGNKAIKQIESIDDVSEYLSPKFIGETNEILLMLAIDNRGKILKCSKISEGSVNYTDVNSRSLIAQLIACNATNVIIAHNHPAGFCVPSKEDVELTGKIFMLLESLGIILVDHLIFSGTESFSMRMHPNFSHCFKSEDVHKTNDNYIFGKQKNGG